jgi:hypothetical protein
MPGSNGSHATGCSRQSAPKRYLAPLIGESLDNKEVPMPSAWQLNYSGIIVDCRDEQDAKSLARELVRKGFRNVPLAVRTGAIWPGPKHLTQAISIA